MRNPLIVSAIAALTVAGAAHAAPASRTFDVKGPDGADAGKATVTEAPRGVLLRLELKGLTPGWHAAHFHEKGDCAAPGFTSAGGHVHGSAAVVHGLLNPAATDSGDLPNIFAGADGKVTVELYSTLVSLTEGQGGRPALLDADGSAVVIHANPDDYMSQPIGGAGARVACGVIE